MNTKGTLYIQNNYKILTICQNVFDKSWQNGIVAGVYKNCFNIITDVGELVTVFKNTDRFSTRALISDVNLEINQLEIKNQMPVQRRNNLIKVGKIVFDMQDADVITLKRKPFGDIQDHSRAFEVFKKHLCTYGKQTPLLCDANISEKFDMGVKRMLQDAADGFNSLVGLGIGLTPSADDYLSGMAAYFYLSRVGKSFLLQLKNFLAAEGNRVTTLVSRHLLADVADGIINDTVYNLIYSINYNTNDIERYLKELINYGSTSGTETCLGIIGAYELCVRKEKPNWL